MGPFTETKWIVCHGPKAVHFSELCPGSTMDTGQPNCECYDDEQSGLDRAAELSGDEQFALDDISESLIDEADPLDDLANPSS